MNKKKNKLNVKEWKLEKSIHGNHCSNEYVKSYSSCLCSSHNPKMFQLMIFICVSFLLLIAPLQTFVYEIEDKILKRMKKFPITETRNHQL